MKAKDGSVKLDNLHPDMALGIEALDRTAKEFGLPEITITSGQDGHHMKGSKHHADDLSIQGEAVDGRLIDLLDRFVARVKTLLEKQKARTFDVVLELTPTICPACNHPLKGTHVHVEHDPK